ncbi:MAG TPA: GNAT family N-acetyltransferase [Kiloniellales bacterium]|nr:GNAT family N-acetyltransferase [Kiloniellales bacterium]
MTLSIAIADRGGLDTMVGWAAREGWNPGLDDAAPFFAADPGGFLIGRIDGEPVASISVVRTGSDFAFLGFYICRPEWRGRGHGWAIWQAGMARLDGRTVGLDGVVAQQDNYRKSGYVLAHRNIRHGGLTSMAAPQDRRLVPLSSVPYAQVAAYDAACFGRPRDAFLRSWLAGGSRRGLAVVDGGLRGFGVVRPCGKGHKIGPLFADDETSAELLFQGLAATVPGEELFLDTPEPNAAAVALARRHGLAPVFETARMYRGADPRLPLPRIFGITSFELG